MLFVGKMSIEGMIKNKFDMRPHNENIESYGRLCRERTNKYMGKNRQIQVVVKMVKSNVAAWSFKQTSSAIFHDHVSGFLTRSLIMPEECI